MRIALLRDLPVNDLPVNDLPGRRSHVAAVEEIFFTSSAVQQFTDDAHRARFKARWLGRYLDHVPESFFVALAPASLLPPPERGRGGWGSTESSQPESARDPKKLALGLDPRVGPVFGQDHALGEKVIGYLAGCLDDPRNNPLFADLGYYAAFGPLCDAYPAHLHINVAAEARSRGVGAALIEAFAAQCAEAKLPGLHLVTNEGARNVRFYEQNGFKVLATTLSHNVPVVFMGRRI